MYMQCSGTCINNNFTHLYKNHHGPYALFEPAVFIYNIFNNSQHFSLQVQRQILLPQITSWYL